MSAATPDAKRAPSRAWKRHGLCAASSTPDLWFPEPAQRDGAANAKAVCRACPVRSECLAYALALGIRHGVWGGTVPEERDGRKARRDRRMDPAARKRKTQAERKRRRRLRAAAAAGDPEAAQRLEREQTRKRTAKSLAAARQRARTAGAAS
jgi:WhiB family redox-sensing transcriptional regulator